MDIQKLRKLKENSYQYFTKKDSLEAVRQDGYSLQYVNPSIFDDMEEEMTLEEIEEELGRKIKIITKNNLKTLK